MACVCQLKGSEPFSEWLLIGKSGDLGYVSLVDYEKAFYGR